MLTVDQRPFKDAVHELIDKVEEGDTWRTFQEDIHNLVDEHGIAITASEFSGHLAKLVIAGNKSRAKKLVNVLDDHAPSRGGAMLIGLVVLTFKWGLRAAFIVFVVWAYLRFLG